MADRRVAISLFLTLWMRGYSNIRADEITVVFRSILFDGRGSGSKIRPVFSSDVSAYAKINSSSPRWIKNSASSGKRNYLSSIATRRQLQLSQQVTEES